MVFFHVFWGSQNLKFDLIWTQSSQNIYLYHFGNIFKIRIQKSINKYSIQFNSIHIYY
jgi:hypothetical protein